MGSRGTPEAPGRRRARLVGSAALGVVLASGASIVTAGIDRAATVDETAVRVDPPAPLEARYRVTFVQEWGPATHPATLPAGWHSSPIVLAAHALPGDMFANGTIASTGIESMAETGRTTLLVGELAADRAVGDTVVGRGISGSGTDVLEVTATQASPLLSLVSMLAPSPDWFVAVRDVAVFDGDRWTDSLALDLVPYDSGTDSGAFFTSANADTRPPQPIGGPRDAGYVAAAAEGRFGRVVIERIA